MKRFFLILAQTVVVGSLLGCGPGDSPPQPTQTQPSPCVDVDNRIVLGDITKSPNIDGPKIQPLADYVAKQLTGYEIVCGYVELPPTTDAMADLLKKDAVDIYFDSAYPAALVSMKTGGTPLVLRRWRNCDEEYRSVIFARVDSDVTSIGDLPGNMIAMEHAESTSGFALAADYLLDQGFKLVVKPDPNEPVAGDEVGIWFSGGDNNTITALLNAAVNVGVLDDYNFTNVIPASNQTDFIVLAQTDPIPRQVVIFRPSLSNELKTAIKSVLLNAHLDPEGIAAMDAASGTCRFDELPEGDEAILDEMSKIANRVRIEIPSLP